MTTYKVTYFNTRGRAEIIRFILAQSGAQWEDNRITKEQWPELKPKTPYGTVPILEFDGKVLAGSKPITGYLAKQFDLLGSNDFENAQIGGILDCMEDLVLKMFLTFYEPDETRKEKLMQDLKETHCPHYLGLLEKVITDNGQDAGWVYGSKVTLADLSLYIVTDFLLKLIPTVLEAFPNIQKNRATVAALPNIAKWLKERPDE